MTEKERAVKYLMCDGCGYAISAKTEPYIILSMMDPREERSDLHFHSPAKVDGERSWGTKDCLHYWILSRVAHGHSPGWDGRGDEKGAGKYTRDLIKNPHT